MKNYLVLIFLLLYVITFQTTTAQLLNPPSTLPLCDLTLYPEPGVNCTDTDTEGGNQENPGGGGTQENPRTTQICKSILEQEGGVDQELRGSIVPCGRVVHQCDSDTTNDQCEFNHIFVLVNNLVRNFITVIFAPLLVVVLMYIGFLFIKDQAAAKVKAKALLLRLLIGTFFVLGAWLIVRFILLSLGVVDPQLLQLFPN